MGDYERHQAYLQKLWNDLLSDEELLDNEEEQEPFEGSSSDEYVPESESDSSSEEHIKSKKLKR